MLLSNPGTVFFSAKNSVSLVNWTYISTIVGGFFVLSASWESLFFFGERELGYARQAHFKRGRCPLCLETIVPREMMYKHFRNIFKLLTFLVFYLGFMRMAFYPSSRNQHFSVHEVGCSRDEVANLWVS